VGRERASRHGCSIENRSRRGSNRLAIRQSAVGPIPLDAEELRIHERIEDGLADGRIDTAQPLRLLNGQAQAGHLEKLAAQPLKGSLHGRRTNSRTPSTMC